MHFEFLSVKKRVSPAKPYLCVPSNFCLTCELDKRTAVCFFSPALRVSTTLQHAQPCEDTAELQTY